LNQVKLIFLITVVKLGIEWVQACTH